MKFRIIFLLLLTAALFSCSEDKNDALKPNQPPETQIFLHLTNPETDAPDTTVSRQELFWYGRDMDGRVVGYFYFWTYFGDESDPANWVWTVEESGVFYVPLQTSTGTYTFKIKAVDNTAVFDGEPAEENPPTSTEGAVDETPAMIHIPVRNSPPEIEFLLRSNPGDDVSDTTFTTRTFLWSAYDLDGQESITHFEWALDDTTEWNTHPGNERTLTIENISEGAHTFFMRAVDIASAVSNLLMYPDTREGDQGSWYVKEPRGPILLVKDDVTMNAEDLAFYTNVFNDIPSLANNFSTWDVTPRLPYYQDDTEATLMMFDAVVWQTYRTPRLPEASPAIGNFVNSGRQLLLCSSWAYDTGDSLLPFLPVDSLYYSDILLILSDTEIEPLVDDYPSLVTGSRVISLADSPAPGQGAESIYLLPASEFPGSNPVATPFGIRYPVGGLKTLVYFPGPLSYCDENGGASEFLRIVLQDDFGF